MNYFNGSILESSKDYGSGDVIICYEGDLPPLHVVKDYLQKFYEILDFEITTTTLPTSYAGMVNPGTIHIEEKSLS